MIFKKTIYDVGCTRAVSFFLFFEFDLHLKRDQKIARLKTRRLFNPKVF